MRLNHEKSKMLEQIKDNTEKIKNNKQLPYLVGNVVEVGYSLSNPVYVLTRSALVLHDRSSTLTLMWMKLATEPTSILTLSEQGLAP